jgi:hypothetical protein
MRSVFSSLALFAVVACASPPRSSMAPVPTEPVAAAEPEQPAAEPPLIEPVATAPAEDVCKPGSAASQSEVWDKLPAPPNEWVSCEADQDCAVAEIGCCDHCNGGRRVVVNSRFAKQAAAKYGPKQCKGNCTEKACAPRVVLCAERKCTDASAPVCDERAENVMERR